MFTVKIKNLQESTKRKLKYISNPLSQKNHRVNMIVFYKIEITLYILIYNHGFFN